MTDGFDGIHAGSFLSWNIAEQNTDENTNEERHIYRPEGDAARHTKHRHNKRTGSPSDKYAYQSYLLMLMQLYSDITGEGEEIMKKVEALGVDLDDIAAYHTRAAEAEAADMQAMEASDTTAN